MVGARVPANPVGAGEATESGNSVETWFGDTGSVVRVPAVAPLSGLTVGVTTERRWQDQAEGLAKLGARVVHGPVVGPVPLARREVLEAVLGDLVRRRPAALVFTTSSGVESWTAAGEHLGYDEALRDVAEGARVLATPDAADFARAASVVADDELRVMPAAMMLAELQATISWGGRIAVQLGDPWAEELVAGLRVGGLDVVEVAPFPRELPDDLGPALDLVAAVIEGRVDAVTFIEAVEVRNLVAIAATAELDGELVAALAQDVVPACMRESCAAAAATMGMTGVVQPEVARPGAMLDALAARLGDAVVRLRLNGVDVELRGLRALVGDEEVWLSERERGVLSALSRRPGTVLSKAELLRRVWRSEGVDGVDGHAVEVAVSRLRRRLGAAGAALATVPRRGYRLDASASR